MSIASRGYENMTAVCINCNSKILYDKNGTQRNVPEMFSMLQKLLGNNPSYEDRPAGRGERRKSSDPANCRMTKEIVKEIASEMFKGCKYAKTKHLNYRQRDKALAMHGYLNYQTYMQSAVWVDKRNRVLRMFDKQCEICKSPACCVHHRWYTIENLFGTSTNGMVAICEYCHTSIEIDENGNKIFNPKLVDANFRQRLEEHQGKLAN